MAIEYVHEWRVERVNDYGWACESVSFPATTEGAINALDYAVNQIHSDEFDPILALTIRCVEDGVDTWTDYSYVDLDRYYPEQFFCGHYPYKVNFAYIRQLDAARAAVFHNPKREG